MAQVNYSTTSGFNSEFLASTGDVLKSRTTSWTDTATGNFTEDKMYVVQTASKVIERCILMATDPGDLVLDPMPTPACWGWFVVDEDLPQASEAGGAEGN